MGSNPTKLTKMSSSEANDSLLELEATARASAKEATSVILDP